MDLAALAENARRARSTCPTWSSRLKRLLWTYANNRLGRRLFDQPWSIRFHYPPPMGDFSAVVRNNGGSDAFIFSEVFDHRYYDFELPKLPDTVLDLGANAGYTAMFFARKYPQAQLACLEPVPGNAAVLRANLQRNRIDAQVLEMAISVGEPALEMALHAKDYGHCVADMLPANETGPRIQVAAIGMSALLDRLGWERVGLLKVDIEGYERVLLTQNCDWLHRVDALAIEYHLQAAREELTRVADAFGFLPPREEPGIWLLVR